jgi:hypothetical protein
MSEQLRIGRSVSDVLGRSKLSAMSSVGQNQLRAHFIRFQDSFACDAIRAQGLPIASGEVEAAHRVIPQKRMKLPGAWWHPTHVNPMLALRVLRANGLWDAFWKQAA